MTVAPLTWQGEDVLLSCHIQPGAKGSAICGLHGDAIRIRIAAPAREGAANDELVRFLADCFHVRRGQVSIERGQSSRHKLIRIQSVDSIPDDLRDLMSGL